MPEIQLQGIVKRYGEVTALAGVTLAVESGELLGVIGPSGSGKTTLVRIIAGLERPDAGSVRIDGEDVTGLEPRRRGVAVVSERSGLYPHLTAGENVGFPMEIRGEEAAAVEERVGELAGDLGLTRHVAKRPGQLGAGHRQGVALGRALAGQGDVLLLDEPAAHLDPALRRRLHVDLAGLRGELTMVYVSNDQSDVASLADRVAVISKGRIRQVGSFADLHDHPADVFVAGFVGSPPMNLARATIDADGALHLGSRVVDMAVVPPRGDVLVGVHPGHLHLEAAGSEGGRIGGIVAQVQFVGPGHLVHLALDADAPDGTPGVEFVVTAPGVVRLRPGDHAAAVFDPAHLHFFDPDTGKALAG